MTLPISVVERVEQNSLCDTPFRKFMYRLKQI